jgi:thioredoxin 1
MLKELQDDNFSEEVLKSTTPYLVDFWAPWCAPCTMIAATVEAIAEKYGERLNVGKINVDDNPHTVERYEIMGIPTLLLFIGGKVVEKFVGVVPRAEIERTMEFHL